MRELEVKVGNLIGKSQKLLIELDCDVFCNGPSYRAHSLPKAEQLLKYSKELVYNLKQLIESGEDYDEV